MKTKILQRDTVFAEPLQSLERFQFDARVARAFDDMIERSVPGYRSIVLQTGLLAARFARANTICYDLGCSLGASSLAMQEQLSRQDHPESHRIIAVDNSTAMLEQMHAQLPEGLSDPPIETRLADIGDMQFQNASVVVLNFTLQFIEPQARDSLLQRIADSLCTGGVLILSEKVCFDDPRQQQLHTSMYEHFKRSNGYSELEISQKREALENVLRPETLQAHKDRLLKSGFSSADVWFQCMNFLSIIALK